MDATTTPVTNNMAPIFAGPFEGSERAAEVIVRVQAFLNGELADLAREHDVDSERGAPRELLQRVWKRSRELGFYGMTLPQKMGGMGLAVLDHALIKEAIYATGSPFAPHVFGELSGPPRVGALARFATPWQMKNFIVPVAEAEKAICFALTEEQAGSDAGAVQTHAVRDGDDYVVNGRKRFISGAPFADFAVLVASTATDPAQREVSAFFVDLSAPGVRVESGYKTMAGQSGTGNIVFENARVPAANLIGEQGRGLALALGRITVNRLLHCPAMVGLAQVALRDARDYALQRRQFGRAIGQFQAIQHMLADMATELAAARALMINTARQIDAGSDARAEASMAKLFCSETAFRVADRAVQIHGGEGIVQGRRVEFLFRLLRMYRVLTGTSEIQRNTIAKELLASETG
ncbi:alkylation response protein AidB-like acyl-CoA dehydrogenase [Variovorax paradoxus]|uniref:acyl-CoA dehydrogenase family protein n=1 Tax=Variovorax atrisoli TaxID=3394203 RepID=UPI00119C6BA6|nr:acyl-CoA dehydrogenase family protein [Variovorax paradoxus]MDR6521404.1 alkylation response protein AidB-like acyl-CoA dehydrogenase [Variovorax paradoxus]